MALEISFLPARQGDAIWVRWGEGHQLLVDLGTEETGEALADTLRALPPAERILELVVITHVDGDHIGGAMTAFAERADELEGLELRDVWFNGWEHLHGLRVPRPEERVGLEGMGPAQGERLAAWLRGIAWNEAFDRGPVERPEDAVVSKELPDGLRLTVLWPTRAALVALQSTWRDEVEKALAKGTLTEVSPGLGAGGGALEAFGPTTPPTLETRTDLALLAETSTPKDSSRANGASIVLLLEYEGRRVLLTGDALGEDVAEGLRLLDPGGSTPLDVIKLPHHCSSKNVTRGLVEAVDCSYWMVSTDGTTFHHPDAIAVARILHWSRVQPVTLGFNVPSTFNGWWTADEWRATFSYAVELGSETEGLTLRWASQTDPAGGQS